MEVTQEEFDKKLTELADKNWKVKNILRDSGGYENLTEHTKKLIDKQLGIQRKEVITEI